jgi:hypothetical protein
MPIHGVEKKSPAGDSTAIALMLSPARVGDFLEFLQDLAGGGIDTLVAHGAMMGSDAVK